MSAFIETRNSGFLVLTLIKNNETIVVNVNDIFAIEELNDGRTGSFIINREKMNRKTLNSYGYAVVESVANICKLLSQGKQI